jgi:hypothetical protein
VAGGGIRTAGGEGGGITKEKTRYFQQVSRKKKRFFCRPRPPNCPNLSKSPKRASKETKTYGGLALGVDWYVFMVLSRWRQRGRIRA